MGPNNEISGSNRRVFVRRSVGERMISRCVFSTVAICHPIWFGLSGTIICFATGQWPNTPPGCVWAILPRRRVMECYIRWPGLHNPPTSTKLRWFWMSRTVEWRKNSQQMLSICGNSFKTVGKAFQVKVVVWENAKSVQSCHQGKRWLLWRISYIKYIWICLTLSFDVFTIILQCRKY